jgi:hypothetical protein
MLEPANRKGPRPPQVRCNSGPAALFENNNGPEGQREKAMKVYFDFNDWWIGYYRGSQYHFVCPLPTVVVRWKRNVK